MTRTPSGAQLELARRVAVPSLEEALLRAAPVGRGRIDPSGEDVTATEVLRVAVGFLAARLVEAPPVVEAPPPPVARGLAERLRGRLRTGHQSYVVVGSSLTAEVVRRSLAAAGGVEGGRHPVALVVGDRLEGLVQGRWTRRVRAGGGLRWRRAWSILEARDAVGEEPLVSSFGPVPAARETHVLLLPPDDAVRCASELVFRDSPRRNGRQNRDPAAISHGTIPPPGPPPDPLPAIFDPPRVDLLRRIHQALATRLDRPARAELAPRLDRWLPHATAHRLAPPPEQAGWAATYGHRLADRLAERIAAPHEGITVHGDPALVVPSSDVSAPRTVPADLALDRALAAIRASAQERA